MSTTTCVERVVLHRVRAPLSVPYALSFGPVEAFDMVLVEAVIDDGGQGWGEATVLTGYTEETIEQAWETAIAKAADLIGLATQEAKRRCMDLHHAAPFTATALVSALEMAEGHAVLDTDSECRAPLLAVINGTEHGAIGEEVEQRLVQGYGTLKVKVGFDLVPDMERLAFIQERVGSRAALRIDANQGYSRADAITFINGIDPAGIELVEQTCAAGDWQAAVAVAKAAKLRGLAMMLDESIYGAADIERAADLHCADIIKLKLMKAGGLDALANGLDRIHRRGMGAVLGNGVAGDIGCWMEACVAARMLDNAGEMNGFLKPRTRLFQVPMHLQAGDLVLAPGDSATGNAVLPDGEALRAHTLGQREFH
jgi:L-alanine-DL-glutamate epimerase-like enolase superfamily enzyme